MYKAEVFDKKILNTEHYSDSRISGALNVFWLGFLLYTSAYSLFRVPPYNVFWNNFQFIGLVLIVLSSLFLIRLRIENSYLRFIYVIYLAWLCFTIARGFQFNYEFISLSLIEAWFGIMPYLVPLVLFLPRNILYLRKAFSVIIVLGFIYLVYCFLFRNDLLASAEDDTIKSQFIMEYFTRNLSIPTGFLLITYPYQTKTRRLIAFLIIAVTVILAMIRARRAIIFMELSYLLSFYIIYLYIKKVRFQVLFFSLVLIGVMSFAGVKLYNKFSGNAFEFITERIDQDTRTGVEECLYDDMTTKEWIIGKGMSGQYYCPGIDHGLFTDYRGMIETDYLNIILKGGIISLILLLLITIPAMIKGIFYSKNLLSKAAGLWILLWLADLYPTVVTTFSMQYILVWISVGICYSDEIRNMPEEKIKELLSFRGNKQHTLI